MFTEKTLEKYADVLLWGLSTARKSGRLNNYEVVTVRYNNAGLRLAEIIHRKLLQKRLHTAIKMLDTAEMERSFYKYADDKQLEFVNAGEKDLTASFNGYIAIKAPESLTHLKDVDPKKFGKVAISRKFLRDIMDRREDEDKFSWTLCSYPTKELADCAGMSVKEYARQIEKACFLDQKDPVKKWKEVFEQSVQIKEWLNGMPIKTLRLESESMDLEISLGERRRFVGVTGHNIPSFEIFTSPDWRGTRGTYFSDLQSYKNGNYVKGIKLLFNNGRVIKATAQRGEAFVRKMLAMDKGASQIGEFSLTDRRLSKIDKFMADTLFDENYGGKYGNSHIALGSSYSDTFSGDTKTLTPSLKEKLGFNYSSLHWDLVNIENKTVTVMLANGKKVLIYEAGIFKY